MKEKKVITTAKEIYELGYEETRKYRREYHMPEDGCGVPEKIVGETFFCIGCLESVSIKNRNQEESKYCNKCYNFIQEEYKTREFLKGQKRKQDQEIWGEVDLKPEEKEPKTKKEKRKVKKNIAMAFVTKNTEYTTENNNGHYTVVEKATGKKFAKEEELPVVKVVEVVKMESINYLSLKELCTKLGIGYTYQTTRKIEKIFPEHEKGKRWSFTSEDVEKIQNYLKK